MWALPSRQLYLLLEMLMRTVYQANQLCTRGGGSLTGSTKSAFLTSCGRGLCCHGAVSDAATWEAWGCARCPARGHSPRPFPAGFMQTERGDCPLSTSCPRVPLAGPPPAMGPPPALYEPSACSPMLLEAAPSWGSSGGARGPAVSAASRLNLICPTVALPPPSCGRSHGGKVKPLLLRLHASGLPAGTEGAPWAGKAPAPPRSPGSAPASPSRASGLLSEPQIDMGKAGSLHSGF